MASELAPPTSARLDISTLHNEGAGKAVDVVPGLGTRLRAKADVAARTPAAFWAPQLPPVARSHSVVQSRVGGMERRAGRVVLLVPIVALAPGPYSASSSSSSARCSTSSHSSCASSPLFGSACYHGAPASNSRAHPPRQRHPRRAGPPQPSVRGARPMGWPLPPLARSGGARATIPRRK